MAIYWPTPGYKGRTFKLCVLTRWDFNFCIRSSPLRGNRREYLPWEDEVCAEFYDVAFRNGRICEKCACPEVTIGSSTDHLDTYKHKTKLTTFSSQPPKGGRGCLMSPFLKATSRNSIQTSSSICESSFMFLIPFHVAFRDYGYVRLQCGCL